MSGLEGAGKAEVAHHGVKDGHHADTHFVEERQVVHHTAREYVLLEDGVVRVCFKDVADSAGQQWQIKSFKQVWLVVIWNSQSHETVQPIANELCFVPLQRLPQTSL